MHLILIPNKFAMKTPWRGCRLTKDWLWLLVHTLAPIGTRPIELELVPSRLSNPLSPFIHLRSSLYLLSFWVFFLSLFISLSFYFWKCTHSTAANSYLLFCRIHEHEDCTFFGTTLIPSLFYSGSFICPFYDIGCLNLCSGLKHETIFLIQTITRKLIIFPVRSWEF